MVEDQILDLLKKYLKEENKEKFTSVMEELQPYDMAIAYKVISRKLRPRFVAYLEAKQIVQLVQELDNETQMEILHSLGAEKSAQILNLMDNDDLADLLGTLSLDKTKDLLALMRLDESQTVQELLKYPPDTAGGIMTNRFVWIRNYYTAREAIEKLKTFANKVKSIYYLYVLDEEKKLAGVVSYRDLLLADANDIVKDIMYDRVISVPVDMDQEDVARAIERYDFLAVPVVDEAGRLVGIVTVDDIIDVVLQEADEDIVKITASGKDIDFQTPAITASVRRLPWLILLLSIGLVSGSIISLFQDTLEKVVALAFFMPMIAGMTGNTGTQSLAVVVRGLVAEDANNEVLARLILRELGVGLIIGVVCGTLIAGAAYLWQQNPALGLVVGFSLFLTLIIGTLAGTIIPLVLYRLGIDPAVASGPLITTLNDIFSLLVYFGLATLFISRLL